MRYPTRFGAWRSTLITGFLILLMALFAIAGQESHNPPAHKEPAAQPAGSTPPGSSNPTEHGTATSPDAHRAEPTGGPAGAAPAGHAGGGHKKAEHKGWGVLDTLGKFVNFLILASVLGYALKGPIRQFVSQRGQDIQRKLVEAQRAREEAQAKLEQVQRAMARLDTELKEIKAQAEKEAAVERDRILKTAQEDAEKVLEMARREIGNLIRSGRAQLKAYAAELTVGLAEEMIKRDLTPEDDQKVFTRFLNNIKSGNGSIH